MTQTRSVKPSLTSITRVLLKGDNPTLRPTDRPFGEANSPNYFNRFEPRLSLTSYSDSMPQRHITGPATRVLLDPGLNRKGQPIPTPTHLKPPSVMIISSTLCILRPLPLPLTMPAAVPESFQQRASPHILLGCVRWNQ